MTRLVVKYKDINQQTSFTANDGLFQFPSFNFGLLVTPVTFKQLMEQVLPCRNHPLVNGKSSQDTKSRTEATWKEMLTVQVRVCCLSSWQDQLLPIKRKEVNQTQHSTQQNALWHLLDCETFRRLWSGYRLLFYWTDTHEGLFFNWTEIYSNILILPF